MAEITAAKVNELRTKTGLGMMECKKALQETEGDVEKAIEYFRKKGVKASITARATSEGRVQVATSADGRTGAIVELNANTDFTAKSDLVAQLMQQALAAMLADPKANPSEALKDKVTAAAQSTGENIHFGRYAVVTAPTKVGAYRYNITGKIGVLMAFEGEPGEEVITDLGGHIAFSKPLGLDRSSVPADIVAKEREIAVEQAKATGKPQQIAEKIAEGKLNAFFKEKSLVDQDFFNSQKFSGTIAEMLKQKGVKLTQYVRLEVGQ